MDTRHLCEVSCNHYRVKPLSNAHAHTYPNAHHEPPAHDQTLHGHRVLLAIRRETRATCRKPDSGRNDYEQFYAVKALPTVPICQPSEKHLANGRAGQSQGIDCDFSSWFRLLEVYESQ